jgi:hypothetical protein
MLEMQELPLASASFKKQKSLFDGETLGEKESLLTSMSQVFLFFFWGLSLYATGKKENNSIQTVAQLASQARIAPFFPPAARQILKHAHKYVASLTQISSTLDFYQRSENHHHHHNNSYNNTHIR